MQRLIVSNWLAIVVNIVVHFALGMAWYGALAAPWLDGIAAQARGFDPQAAPPAIYLTSMVSVLLSSLFVAKLMDLADERTIAGGVKWGLTLGAAIGLPLLLMHYAFAGNPLSLVLIDGGYELLSLVLTGIVLGALGFRGRVATHASLTPAV